jgi:energy-coupling factor transporter ATP-binding protein EcfA2
VKVCLFGPDGSGKTTAAKILAAYLRRRGVKVRIPWMRGTHAAASLLARAMRPLGLKGTSNSYYGIDIPPTLYQLWWALELLSAPPIWMTRYALPRNVVGDRCPVDLVVWVAATTDTRLLETTWARAALALARRYTLVCLHAPPKPPSGEEAAPSPPTRPSCTPYTRRSPTPQVRWTRRRLRRPP